MKQHPQNSGTTLIETIVSMFMLGLLMALMFSIYRLGAVSWRSGEADAELAQSAQIVTGRLTKEVARSALSSVSLDPGASSTAVSFLSPIDPVTSLPDYDGAAASPIWHSYSIYYYDAAEGDIRWKSLPLATPTTSTPPLTTLPAERNDGARLTSEVTRCDFEVVDRALEIFISVERKRYGKESPDRLDLRSSICFRN